MFKLLDLLYWLMFFATLATVALAWAIYLLKSNKPSPNEKEFEEFENRMLELMGQFRHLSAVRMQMLDKKIEEMRKLIQQANSLYAALSCQEANVLAKTLIKEEGINETERSAIASDSQTEVTENISVQKDSKQPTQDNQDSLERKILLLYQEGKNESQIARELGIGIGEVMLVLSLFRFRTDLR